MVKSLMVHRVVLISSLSALITFCLSLFASQQEPVNQYQDISLIKKTEEDFIYRNTATLPGQIIANVDKIDQRHNLPKCPELEAFVPTGGRLWGKTSIGVRCNSQLATWTLYVQAEINVMASVLHIARPVSSGKALVDEDIAPQIVNLTQMPDGIFTDAKQVIGKVATSNLTAGQPLRSQMLRAPHVILRGQKVSLVIQGRGFSISSEGQALADAAEGQVVQVRNKSGKIISGLARMNAIVEIQP